MNTILHLAIDPRNRVGQTEYDINHILTQARATGRLPEVYFAQLLSSVVRGFTLTLLYFEGMGPGYQGQIEARILERLREELATLPQGDNGSDGTDLDSEDHSTVRN